MPKIIQWDENKTRQELIKRYRYSRDSRSKVEKLWEENERIIYANGFGKSGKTNLNMSNYSASGIEDIDSTSKDVSIVYGFKNLRFLHAQLSANPPSVIPRPTSNDQDDRRKADAADRLVRHAIRAYSMQERIDRVSLNCLTYGTGFMKTIWDGEGGKPLSMSEDGEMTMEGDFDFSIPSPWNVTIDPDAEFWEDVRYVFERKLIPYEEALYRWPDKKEVLDANRMANATDGDLGTIGGGASGKNDKYDVVEIFEYWEKGLAVNGFLGRFVIHVRNGDQLEPIKPNPFRFKPAKDAAAKYEVAKLPYHIFTDIDLPNQVWGKSFLDYVAPLQDTINRIDTVSLDNAQAHGVARLVLPEGAEIAEDAITNSPWDVIKITGNQPPFFVSAPTLMPAMDNLRTTLKLGIDDLSGVNESMFGQQSREQSGFSMQYATNQGNMIRRRLFNKYVMFVESVYKSYLELVRKHWGTKRTIKVLGKEKALEAIDIQGADIDGGFDLIVEYGASLSLDPMTRREEVMAMQPIFEKAGVPVRVSLKMMKLNELEGLYDMMQLAEDRQREIFEEMIAKDIYLPPESLLDHENMLAYAMTYLMTTEFKYLDDDYKVLIKRHIEERAAMAAAEKAPMAPQGGPPVPGIPGAPGPLPTEEAPVGGNPPPLAPINNV